MIQITKAEAKEVRKHYPNVHIAKTKNKRYLEESLRYLILIPFNVEAARLVKQMTHDKKNEDVNDNWEV